MISKVLNRRISKFLCPFCKQWHVMKDSEVDKGKKKTLADFKKNTTVYDIFWCESWRNYFSIACTEENLIVKLAACTCIEEYQVKINLDSIIHDENQTVIVFDVSNYNLVKQKELCKKNFENVVTRYDCTNCTSKKYNIFEENLHMGFELEP